jgi:hypothetical protein
MPASLSYKYVRIIMLPACYLSVVLEANIKELNAAYIKCV